MAGFAASTLMNLIIFSWNPANTRIPKNASAGVEQIVHFLTSPQITGSSNEWPITVEASKTLDPAVPDNENQVVRPKYTEVRHRFTITCRYRVRNTDPVLYAQAQEDIEDMCVETVSILKTIYNPQTTTGAFFGARYNWSNNDKLNGVKPELVRTLEFELTEIQSKSDEVFRGYGGILSFDLSNAANMDSAPGADYAFTEAYNVRIREGTSVTEVLTKDTVNGARVPKLGSGRFRGTFTADIYAKKSDIGSTAEKLNQIYTLQANGQHIEAAFLHDVDNTESTPVTLTQTSFVKVTSMTKNTTDESLTSFNVEGRLIKPSTFATA